MTDVETTKNIVTAIRNSPDENLRYYDVDLFNKSVVISQRSVGSAISLTTNVTSTAGALVATAIIGTGLLLSHLNASSIAKKKQASIRKDLQLAPHEEDAKA